MPASWCKGPDKRFYLYAPVEEGKREHADPFVIGVAVSDSVLGSWKDAHPSGPIVSQSIPEHNRMQNIDPTVMVDNDGRVYMYWGTFGQLRGIELERDMVTPKGREVKVTSLPGFFEAARLFRRKDTYYLLYADNQVDPHSPCTEAVDHACIAYGTASSLLGPWTYGGVVLDTVSSPTSHSGVIEFKGKWYIVYHTADAKGGGHFRRSVAIDTVQWDDSVSPARVLKVTQKHEPRPPLPPTRNLALAARATASNEPVPVQYWIKSLNDGVVRPNPLPPDMWGSWSPHNPASQWIQYDWALPSPSTAVASCSGAIIRLAPGKEWRCLPRAPGILERRPMEPCRERQRLSDAGRLFLKRNVRPGHNTVPPCCLRCFWS